MQLNRIRLENFRLHELTELEIGPGLTGIIGPNGSGKSTILEAIAWVIYGTPAARGTTGSIRFYRAPPKASVKVEMDFRLGKHEYRVVRTLKKAELIKDGHTIANSLTSVTGQLTRLLGMSRQEFFNTYFTGQKELVVMAAMGAAERGRFLARLLGYENLKRAQDQLREQRNTLKGEVQGLEAGLVDTATEAEERERLDARVDAARGDVAAAERTRQVARDELAASEPAWRDAQAIRERYLALEGERRIAEAAVETATKNVARLGEDLDEAMRAVGRLTELDQTLSAYEPLREELKVLDERARADTERKAQRALLAELESGVEQLTRKLAASEVVVATIEGATGRVARMEKELAEITQQAESLRTDWVRDQQDADTNIKSLLSQYDDAKQQRTTLQELGPEGTCPTCRRPLEDHYEEVLEVLDRQLEAIQGNGTYFRQRAEQLRREPTELAEAEAERKRLDGQLGEAKSALAELKATERERQEQLKERTVAQARIADLRMQLGTVVAEYDAARHDVVRDRVRTLEPAAREAERLRDRAARVAELRQQVDAAREEVSSREVALGETLNAREALGYSESRVEEARMRRERAEQSLRTAEVGVAEARGRLTGAEEALGQFEERAVANQQRRARWEALRVQARLHGALDRAYQDLRNELIARLRPELADVASQFLSDLTTSRYTELEIDDQYQVAIIEDGMPKPVISGGEEDISNLVLRLAISQLVAERAGQPLSLLVLDEIFGSLDELRRHNVVELLRALADRFPQVILITHIESVRDGLDRVIRVVYDQQSGASRVTDETDVYEPHDVAV